MPQDAAFTHLKPVCASPQTGTTNQLLRLSLSREGDGVLRATTEFISRYKNLTHFVSEGRNHRSVDLQSWRGSTDVLECDAPEPGTKVLGKTRTKLEDVFIYFHNLIVHYVFY